MAETGVCGLPLQGACARCGKRPAWAPSPPRGSFLCEAGSGPAPLRGVECTNLRHFKFKMKTRQRPGPSWAQETGHPCGMQGSLGCGHVGPARSQTHGSTGARTGETRAGGINAVFIYTTRGTGVLGLQDTALEGGGDKWTGRGHLSPTQNKTRMRTQNKTSSSTEQEARGRPRQPEEMAQADGAVAREPGQALPVSTPHLGNAPG